MVGMIVGSRFGGERFTRAGRSLRWVVASQLV